MNALVGVGLGFGLGVVTGMPLGVINVALVDAATSGRARFAVGLGLGSALADSVHAALAFAGVGRLVTAAPVVTRGLAIGAAAAIVAYAITAWRQRRIPTTKDRADRRARGLATGIALTLPNPGALAAWVAVAAALWPDARPLDAIAVAAGVGTGSALWFTALARGARRIPPDHRALRIVPKLALGVLVAIAITGVVRAFV